MAEAEETATTDNELGEMASFLNGGSGGGGVANGGAQEAASSWDQELEAGGGLKGGQGAVSDGEEVRYTAVCPKLYGTVPVILLFFLACMNVSSFC